MTDYLYVHGVYLVSLEALLAEFLVHGLEELVVEDIPVTVVETVIQVDVPFVVHVEIHFVVGACAALVDAYGRELRQYVVNACHGYLHFSRSGNISADHIGTGVPQFKHRLVHCHTLPCGFESVRVERVLEFFHHRYLMYANIGSMSRKFANIPYLYVVCTQLQIMDKKKIILLLLVLSLPVRLAGAVEWRASWIGAPWESEECSGDSVFPAPEFRKTFEITRRVKSATARVTGLGFFEFSVNGRKVGDEVLCPNETLYSHRKGLGDYMLSMDDTHWRGFRVFYLTYDITSMLHRGSNELGMLLGNGFYSCGRSGWVCPYGSPRMLCQVEVEYVDGTGETICSDTSWEVRRSPILLNDLYEGEIYDARLEDRGEWIGAVPRKAPDGKLMPQDGPADRVMEVLGPKSVTRLPDGRWEVDFGDYVSGWVRLMDFTAEEGAEISLEFPIETSGNGQYRYTAKGGRVESYAPRFSWWVFEKAIVSGWPGELKPSNIRAEVVHSDVKRYEGFACSDTLLNRIDRIWKRTQTDNMHLGVATDCPHREKGPYTGDGEAACVAVMHNFDARAFYRKWLHDMSDCQDTLTGYVPNGAPWHPGCGGGVPWGAAMCIIPWEYYLHYGGREVLEENYLQMTEEVRYLEGWRRDDGTVLQQITRNGEPLFYFNLGEWCPPYNLPSERFIHTWYLWRCADYTARAARALGKADDAERFRSLADDVAAAFHKAFYDPVSGSYNAGGGRKTDSGYGTGADEGAGDGSNIFALAMGVPEEHRQKVVEAVKAELEANDGHLNTGIYGSGLFFEVLCDNGMAEEAYTAMTKKDFPGFGWWVAQGAKTTWEEWNGNNSRNHPMFGGALVWLYRRICGVRTDEDEPGYRHVIVKPTPVGDLKWASYSVETDGGPLSVRWDRKKDRFRLRVRIPEGSRATICLPDGSSPIEAGPGEKVCRCRIPR